MRGMRFLAAAGALVLVLSVLAPAVLAHERDGDGNHDTGFAATAGAGDSGRSRGRDGHAGSTSAVYGGKQGTGDSVYSRDHGQGSSDSVDEEDEDKGHGTSESVYGDRQGTGNSVYGKGEREGEGSDQAVYGNCPPEGSGMTLIGANGFPVHITVAGTTSDRGTTPGGISGSAYGSTSGSTYGGAAVNCGRDVDEEHHRDAVEKVLDKLKDKLEELDPTAAAKVQQVIDRLTAELQAAGLANSTSQAVYDLTQALQQKAVGGKVSKTDLDLLAELQSERGDDAEALATRMQRVALDPTDRNAYVALGEQERKDHGPPEDISAFVDGKVVKFDVKPLVKDGRTLVPVRAVVEVLGAQVNWNGDTQTVTIRRGDTTIQLQIGSSTATVNGRTVTLDVPASIEGGRTVVPLRAVAELLGMKVEWLGDYKMIVITPAGTSPGGSGGAGSSSGP